MNFFLRSFAAAALAVAATAAVADDYTLPLVPGASGSATSSFTAQVNGLFIDNYSFSPMDYTGHLAVSFTALTPSVSFFVGDLNGQTFSFFPEDGATSFDFAADTVAGTPIALTIFGAALDTDGVGFVDGSYSLNIVATPPVPEPGTYALMLAGLVGLVAATGAGKAARQRRRIAPTA